MPYGGSLGGVQTMPSNTHTHTPLPLPTPPPPLPHTHARVWFRSCFSRPTSPSTTRMSQSRLRPAATCRCRTTATPCRRSRRAYRSGTQGWTTSSPSASRATTPCPSCPSLATSRWWVNALFLAGLPCRGCWCRCGTRDAGSSYPAAAAGAAPLMLRRPLLPASTAPAGYAGQGVLHRAGPSHWATHPKHDYHHNLVHHNHHYDKYHNHNATHHPKHNQHDDDDSPYGGVLRQPRAREGVAVLGRGTSWQRRRTHW